jgi:hypothetical protein
MTTFLAAVALFGLSVCAMAIGVLVQGRKLRGSCGHSEAGACQCSPLAARHCPLRREREARAGSH